jgi:hypothetical protein
MIFKIIGLLLACILILIGVQAIGNGISNNDSSNWFMIFPFIFGMALIPLSINLDEKLNKKEAGENKC